MTRTRTTRDFTEGKIFFPMLKFAIPVILAGCLQQLYNTADKIVVGRFSGEPNALGAIGCTVSLYTLLVAFCNGLSMGSGVTVAHRFGEHDERSLSRTVHTAFAVGTFIGVLMAGVGGTRAKCGDIKTVFGIDFLGVYDILMTDGNIPVKRRCFYDENQG